MIQTDTLLNNYKILQDPERFMFGIDAVLLSNFSRQALNHNEKLFDLCTGNGIVPLLLCDFVNKIDAIEIQKDSADLAVKSVQINALEQKIAVTNGDLKNISTEKLFEKHSYNCVTCNPPYMINEHGRQNETDAKTIARHEICCTLDDVVAAADFLLHTHGKFFMIHRPFRLPEIFAVLKKYSFEPKRMQLVYPFIDKEPNLVLIEARKNASPRLKIEKPLFVYDKPGLYTKEINDIYDSFRNQRN